MSGSPYIPVRQTPVNASGRPYGGAKANFYLAGSLTATPVYTTSSLGVPHPQPVPANSAGRFPAIYLDPQYDYRCIQTTAANVVISDDDNIPGSHLNLSEIGATLYPRTAAEITADVTPTLYHYPPGDVRRYGADPNGVEDSTQALNDACACNSRVTVPTGTYLSGRVEVAAGTIIEGDYRLSLIKPVDDTVTTLFSIIGTGYPTGSKNFTKIANLMFYNGAVTDTCVAIRARWFDELHLEQVIVDGFYDNISATNGAFVYGLNVRSWSATNRCLYLDCDGEEMVSDVGLWASFINSEFVGSSGPYNAYVEDWATVRFIKCEFGSGTTGLLVKQAYTASVENAADVVITYSGFDSCEGIGLKLDTIRAFTIAHNWISSGRTNVTEGCNISACRQGSILDNDFANCGDSGLQITNSQEISIRGNRAYANGQEASATQGAGIRLSSSSYCVVDGNFAVNENYGFGVENQLVGITFDGTSDHNIVVNNVATGNDSAQISLGSGTANIVHSNIPTTLSGSILSGSATYNPSSMGDGVGQTTTVTVTGAALGDFVDGISISEDLLGVTLSGYVSATDTVAVRYQNESGGTLDFGSHTIRVRVRKQ